VFKRRHGIDLLDKALLELGVFDHLLLREALDGVGGGGGSSLGREQHVPEAPLADFPDAVELITVQDVPSLQFLAALKHYLI
jgi:hypothetical protein